MKNKNVYLKAAKLLMNKPKHDYACFALEDVNSTSKEIDKFTNLFLGDFSTFFSKGYYELNLVLSRRELKEIRILALLLMHEITK